MSARRESKRMKQGLSIPAAVVASGVLVVCLAGAEPPRAARGGDASGPPAVAPPVRRVHVHRTWCEPGTDSGKTAGIALCTHVEALGLRWHPLLVELRLRTPDGKPVRVAAQAPEGYEDLKGEFYLSTQVLVRGDRYQWPELRTAFSSRKVLDLPAGKPRRLIAAFRASSGGLSSSSEAEITVPPTGAPRVERAVRLLAIDTFPNSMPPEAADDSAEGRKEVSPPAPAQREPGLTVWAYVEAVGLDKQRLVGRLSFRDRDGKPLVWKGRKTEADKPFESKVRLEVLPRQAQVLLHFVPYSAIGLKPGDRRCILTYAASCQGLTAELEEEYAVRVATAAEDAASEPEIRRGPGAPERLAAGPASKVHAAKTDPQRGSP